jgi:hypothetical protein
MVMNSRVGGSTIRDTQILPTGAHIKVETKLAMTPKDQNVMAALTRGTSQPKVTET